MSQTVQLSQEQYDALIKKLTDMQTQINTLGQAAKGAVAEVHKVHACSAFKLQKHYDPRFPTGGKDGVQVPVSGSQACPYCEMPIEKMELATSEQIAYLEGS